LAANSNVTSSSNSDIQLAQKSQDSDCCVIVGSSRTLKQRIVESGAKTIVDGLVGGKWSKSETGEEEEEEEGKKLNTKVVKHVVTTFFEMELLEELKVVHSL